MRVFWKNLEYRSFPANSMRLRQNAGCAQICQFAGIPVQLCGTLCSQWKLSSRRNEAISSNCSVSLRSLRCCFFRRFSSFSSLSRCEHEGVCSDWKEWRAIDTHMNRILSSYTISSLRFIVAASWLSLYSLFRCFFGCAGQPSMKIA